MQNRPANQAVKQIERGLVRWRDLWGGLAGSQKYLDPAAAGRYRPHHVHGGHR